MLASWPGETVLRLVEAANRAEQFGFFGFDWRVWQRHAAQLPRPVKFLRLSLQGAIDMIFLDSHAFVEKIRDAKLKA